MDNILLIKYVDKNFPAFLGKKMSKNNFHADTANYTLLTSLLQGTNDHSSVQ